MKDCKHASASYAYCPCCESDVDITALNERLKDALLKIEILENEINRLHKVIAFLES